MLRRQKIKIMQSYFDSTASSGLELGPHVNPMFRKSEGFSVQYLEVRGSDELRAAMVSDGRDPKIVEDIDFVLQRGFSLAENVGGKLFDWVVSSHVVEHIPNFALHLNEVSSVLREGGVYALLVPDRNYCFDVGKPPTSLGDVIEAFIGNRSSGTISHFVDELRYAARPEGVTVGGWKEADSAKPLVPKHPDWLKLTKKLIKSKGVDAEDWFGHQWFFDPVNFSSIVVDLIDLKLIELELVHVQPTYNMDFIAVLRKAANPRAARGREISLRLRKNYRRPQAQPAA